MIGPRSLRHRTVAISSGCLPLSDASSRAWGAQDRDDGPTEVSHQTFIPGWSATPEAVWPGCRLAPTGHLGVPSSRPVEVESRACKLRRNTPAGSRPKCPRACARRLGNITTLVSSRRPRSFPSRSPHHRPVTASTSSTGAMASAAPSRLVVTCPDLGEARWLYLIRLLRYRR